MKDLIFAVGFGTLVVLLWMAPVALLAGAATAGLLVMGGVRLLEAVCDVNDV